ncbi:DNA-processing protein DprA [Paracoccus sp. p3-h83]|uniref:DNA-processing protein DprA n=1 Tax=Paracoccus sp. p3-h83 TaxID=3342805 RepID=UPI0035B84198
MKTGLFSFHTPNTPHPQEEDALAALRLIRSRRVGPATWLRLVAEHGDPATALAALPQVAAQSGMTDYTPCPMGVARAEWKAGQKAGARLLVHGLPGYPAALLDLADAPPVLWALGDVTLLDRPMVALVGARNASSLGLRMARHLAAELGAAGQVVVAGLARGIDTAAHQAALDTGTIAVQAGGVDHVYPAENGDLATQIAAQGLRLSEGPMGAEPQARHFPQRNRIIAGLSRAVVVVEAAHKSGSLITARLALDQGREVMAVPGHPFDARAAGANDLIRDGATLVRGAGDVLAALGVDRPHREAAPRAAPQCPSGPHPHSQPGLRERVQTALHTRPSTLAAQGVSHLVDRLRGKDGQRLHQRILDRLGPSPLPEDDLLADLALPLAQVSPALLELELRGDIQRSAGGMLSRTG